VSSGTSRVKRGVVERFFNPPIIRRIYEAELTNLA
jgi:hypothetical protein